MIWAQIENNKILASPNAKAFCPMCKEKVIAKCGNKYVWHWSHIHKKDCDEWFESESVWHLLWKNTFGKNKSEITISKGQKKHRADVFTESGIVIELQNSPISSEIIKEREEFYGEKMLWIINGQHLRQSCEFVFEKINPYAISNNSKLRRDAIREKIMAEIPLIKWFRAKRNWQAARRNIFIDFGEDNLFWVEEGMGTKRTIGVYVEKKAFLKKYGGDYKYYSNEKINLKSLKIE
jgi:competence CoiA-like predicted nuclease